MAKMKNVADRFHDLILEDIMHRNPAKRLLALGKQFGLIYGAVIMRPRIDWRNRDFRAAVAETSLQLSNHYMDDSLRKAFEDARLDPNDPQSWATLLRIFSFAHFPPKKKKREDKVAWDWRRWSQLLADFAAVKEIHPNHKDSPICDFIKNRFSSRYPKIKSDTIRRNLQYARDVETNKYLKKQSEFFVKSIEEAAAKRGHKLSPTKVESKAIEKAIQKIAKEWKKDFERK